MQISQIIQAKGDEVATITDDATVGVALAELAQRSIGALVVSEDGRRVSGIVSERDIVRQLHIAGADVVDQPISSIMTHAVRTCSPDDSIDSVMAMMTDLRIRHLPVVVDGALVGIVSIGDVVKARIDELERDRRDLVEYISAR